MKITATAVMMLSIIVRTHKADMDLLSKAPMREWVNWIKDLRPTHTAYRGPNSPLTADQWAVERVYIVLFRLTQQCESDGYAIKITPFDTAVARYTGLAWTGVTFLPGHVEWDRGSRILGTVDVAYEKYGKMLCASFNRRLGRNGDLVSALRRFTANNGPAQRYGDIVMWSDAEICQRPREFWEDDDDWKNPRSRALIEQLTDQSCKAAATRAAQQ